jgi:NADH-quinone oxidoreductase subunit C
MENFADKIKIEIESRFESIQYVIDTYQDHNVVVGGEQLHTLVEWLKNQGFGYLTDLTGNHFPDNQDAEFQVVYHIHNLKENHRIRLKVNLSEKEPIVDTITDLFSAANWMERETYDFFGIQFKGHPNLKRILNMDDMDYHPMRKEYALEDATREDKKDSFFGR